MKLIAHRGWSAGEGENTIKAFKKALQNPHIEGVEFDVWENEKGIVVVKHNPLSAGEILPTLAEVLDLFHDTKYDICIEYKMWSESLHQKVTEEIKNRNMTDRAFVFAFPEIAHYFPWQNRGAIRLGIISLYPWHIKKDIETYKPDTLLFGWGNPKERLQFKLWWTLIGSLRCVVGKYPDIHFIGGVAFREKDIMWLRKQNLYASTADFAD